MNYIENIDRELLLLINGVNSPLVDEIMWQISHQFIWIPLYIFILYYIFKTFTTKQFIFMLIGVGLCFLLADRISVMWFKNIFFRYRPTHNIDIKDQIHTYINANGDEYRGGLYGFVSSHAANFFALSTFLFLSLKKQSKWWALLLVWAMIIGYSRIYLGVHYPLDVVGGGLLGITIGIAVYKVLFTFSPLKDVK